MKKKLLSSFSFTFLSSGLFFGFTFFVAKYFGAKEYGKISYYLSFVFLTTLFIGFNHPGLYMGERITKQNKNAFSLFFTIESIFFIIVFLPAIYILIDKIKSIEISILILFIAYFTAVIGLIGLEFNARKEIEKSILFSALLPRILFISLFLLAILLNFATPRSYLYIYLISFFSIGVYFLYKWKPKFYLKKDIFKRAWKFYLLGIIGASFKPLANILQKEYYGYKEVANLSLALLFLAGFYLIGSVLVKFVLPKVHEAWRSKDLKTIEKLYSNNTTLEVILISPLVIVILINIDLIIKFLGTSYDLLGVYLTILMIGFLPDLFTGITGNLLRSTENEKYEIFNEILVLISGLGLIYLLKDYKYGVVVAISISTFLYNIAKLLEVYILLKIKPFDLKKIFLLILYILFLIIIFKSIASFNFNTFFKLVLISIMLLVIYIFNYKIIKKLQLLKGFE